MPSPEAMNPGLTGTTKRTVDALAAVGVIGILFMMLIPLPTWLLSFFLVLNLALSVTVLLMTTYVRDILQFSVFPTLLLGMTLFRLALNISSTKLVLLQADAGTIVQAFGEVVVKGNVVVGFIVFLILIIVQFIVITKGAERVSEVAARFTLDALPGKQMGVDAELNAGIIDETQARARRESIEQEADFYGAMDGASKFVRGDAIASIVVTVINILGGIAVGFLQRDMGWVEVLRTYIILTIGDGLVHQVPALIISTATGILVTRSAAKSTLADEVVSQFTVNAKALNVAAGTLALIGVSGAMTGLPVLPFLVVAAVLKGASSLLNENKKASQKVLEKAKPKKAAPKGPEDVSPLLAVETLELELGYGLLFLVDPNKGGDLMDRIGLIRRNLAKDLGLIVPPVRIRDNGLLSTNTYAIKIRGALVAKAEIVPRQLLAMGTGLDDQPLEGTPTKEPTFGLPAVWIPPTRKREAEISGYTVVDNASVIATHLTEVLKSHAHELLGRQEVQGLLNDLKSRGYTTIFEELIPNLMSVGSVQKVLQNLLRERISIRNLLIILETLADTASATKDPEVLTEYVRAGLSRQISNQHASKQGDLLSLTLNPDLEKQLFESVQRSERGGRLVIDPVFGDKLIKTLTDQLNNPTVSGSPVLLCAPTIRPYLKRYLEPAFPNLSVLSYNEVASDVGIKTMGSVSVPLLEGQAKAVTK